jgi:hypothetical protein
MASHSTTVTLDALASLPSLRRGVKLAGAGWRACCGPASVHRLPLQLAVKAELPRKATTEQVKGMQRDLVVQVWSNHGRKR